VAYVRLSGGGLVTTGASGEATYAGITKITTPAVTDSSATSYTIGQLPLGALTFTTTQGNAFTSGQLVTIADSSSPTTRFITGVVTGYDKATSTVRVVVVTSQGQGTVSSWTISG
jgi:hypothetical protein